MSVCVKHSLHRVGRHLEAGPTKTAAGMRAVVLMASTATTMRAHLRIHVAPGPQAILFPALRGSGYTRDTALTRLLTAAQDVAGIEIPDGYSGGWHTLRHYSATRYGQAGATTRADDSVRVVRSGNSSTVPALRRGLRARDSRKDGLPSRGAR